MMVGIDSAVVLRNCLKQGFCICNSHSFVLYPT